MSSFAPADAPQAEPVASSGDDNDWLASVAAPAAEKSGDWLSQFAVVETPKAASDDTPEWMRDTEQANTTASAETTPDWLRDTESAAVSAEHAGGLDDLFGPTADTDWGSASEVEENAAPVRTGMTGLLNAMSLPKTEPAASGSTDVLNAQNLPDWMNAFASEDAPTDAESFGTTEAIQPDFAGDLSDLRTDSAADWQLDTLEAMPQDMPATDESTAVVDEAQSVPDWLAALGTSSNDSLLSTPEPETAVLDLSAEPDAHSLADLDFDAATFGSAVSDQPVTDDSTFDPEGDIDIDQLLTQAETANQQAQDDIPLPDWMSDLAPEPAAKAAPVSAIAWDDVPEPEAPPITPPALAAETPAAGSGFTFNRKPAWLNKVKK